MKKLTAILLSLILAAGFVACSKGGNTGDGTKGSGNGSSDTEPDIVVTEPKTTEPKQTDPNETKPEDTDPPVVPDPVSGFCAVGEVDTAEKLAAILLQNGTVKTVKYAGGDPVPGAVAAFATEDDIVVFTAVEFTDYTMWRVYSDPSGDLFYGTDGVNEFRVPFDENAATFLRFSQTDWRVISGKTPLNIASIYEYPNTAWPGHLVALDANGDGTIDVIYVDATERYDDGEVKDPTTLFSGTAEGFSEGDKKVTLTK